MCSGAISFYGDIGSVGYARIRSRHRVRDCTSQQRYSDRGIHSARDTCSPFVRQRSSNETVPRSCELMAVFMPRAGKHS
jgi:hypothetical protein